MSTLKSANLKNLMLTLGDRQVATATALRKRGYSYENLKGYVKSGYLSSLGRGAYCKAGADPSVEAALVAVSERTGNAAHLGGRSALAKRGFLHFVPFGQQPATIFLCRGTRLPAWFSGHYAGRCIVIRTNFLPADIGVEKEDGCPVSSPERAFLEFLHGVPAKQSLAEAFQILETMRTLRPRLLNDLLAACGSVKVKRLFFLLADDLKPQWLGRVKAEDFDLGSGCRVVDKDGAFDAKHNLVVKPWREI